MANNKSPSGRGFRGMDPKKQREIAAKGGRASHGSRKSPTSKASASTSRTAQNQGTNSLM